MPEVTSVSDHDAVVHTGTEVRVFEGLEPDSRVDLDGLKVTTLPAAGELLCTFTSVNDVHFGEQVAGVIHGVDEWPGISSEPAEGPYPEFMSQGAIDEMKAVEPSLVVVKGDLTSGGTQAEFERFREVYHGAFGDEMIYIRGNHESFHGLQCDSQQMQERQLPGVTVALMDTSRDGQINGSISSDQIEWLDELAARADRPVMVFGHHPVWDAVNEERTDATFGLLPDATDELAEVFARRKSLVGYFAGHTHRNHLVTVPQVPDRVFAEVASVKDFPGSWAEYRVFDGAILQVHRRISNLQALSWSERARHMYGGLYGTYALGELSERCFAMANPL